MFGRSNYDFTDCDGVNVAQLGYFGQHICNGTNVSVKGIIEFKIKF